MAQPTFDLNMWYHLYIGDDDSQAYEGSGPVENGTTRGYVKMDVVHDDYLNQRWQIWPVNSTYWALRTSQTTDMWMASYNHTDDDRLQGLLPCMLRGDVADATVLWTFSAWEDGTWFLSNAAYGSGRHIQMIDQGAFVMSPNVTAPQTNQRWRWKPVSSINSQAFSTINIKGVATSTAMTTSSSTSPTSLATPTSGPLSTSALPSTAPSQAAKSDRLSTGAKAAIGASFGAIALIGSIVIILFLLRRRRQKAEPKSRLLPPFEQNTYNANHVFAQYEMFQEGSKGHEVEVPRNERPVELSGDSASIKSKSSKTGLTQESPSVS